MARSKVKSRLHQETAHLQPPGTVPTKYQLLLLMLSETLHPPNFFFLLPALLTSAISENNICTTFKDVKKKQQHTPFYLNIGSF